MTTSLGRTPLTPPSIVPWPLTLAMSSPANRIAVLPAISPMARTNGWMPFSFWTKSQAIAVVFLALKASRSPSFWTLNCKAEMSVWRMPIKATSSSEGGSTFRTMFA